jgi:hypothetical protein
MKYKPFYKSSTLLAFIAAIALAVAGQQAATQVSSVDALRQHITYLASDKLEGRRTGSAGANLAAEYIARQFSRSGLRRSNGYDTPGMSRFEADSPTRYYQKFPYVAGVELGRKNSLTLKFVSSVPARRSRNAASSIALYVGEDWLPLGLSTNGRIENSPVVLVGYGLTISELKYDDYADAKASGKIALAFTGTPDGDNPHGQFARYDDVRWKAIAARNAGAKALIVIASDSNFKQCRRCRSARHCGFKGGCRASLVVQLVPAG